MRFVEGVLLAASLLTARSSAAEQRLENPEAIAFFLRTAQITDARPIGKGTTNPFRLTLSDGETTHDAAFQSIDERAPVKELEGGNELRFADTYHFNIAAFHVAELLGLAMVPVSVERTWNRRVGSLTWWVEHKWDQNDWKASGVSPPDSEAWNRQIFSVRVFTQLLHDDDRNRGNLLITEDWKIWMIDFTRAFRPWRRLKSAAGLDRCDGALLQKLRELSRDRIEDTVTGHLSREEIDALLARRDLIVSHYDRLIRERGGDQVLY